MHPPTTEWSLDPAVPVPLRHRIMWSPITALVCFAAMITADVILGLTIPRVVGLGVGALWLGLAIHNRRTAGAFLRGLYAPDDSPIARMVEPERD